MSAADMNLQALVPLMVLGATPVVVLLAMSIVRRHALAMGLTLAGLGASIVACCLRWSSAPCPVTPLLVADRYALFYTVLILAATMVTILFSYNYLRQRRDRREEYYPLLAMAALGAAVMVWSDHFASFFLGLELLSISLYALIAYQRESIISLEAGTKYLVLAGVSSPLLLMGMALVYADLGTMQLSKIVPMVIAARSFSVLALAGWGLIVTGLGFKLAVAPFHLWTPDVYQGAPAPVAGFIATVSKGAAFALLLRYFTQINVYRYYPLMLAFTLIAIVSMFLGNLLALRQNNLKRILAYSSISHMGYLLVAFGAAETADVRMNNSQSGATAVTFYLVAYFATTLAAFGVVTILSHRPEEAQDLHEYQGLAWRRPWLGAALTAALLSLAGIPLTGGFLAKFYVLTAGMRAGLYALVVVLVVNSAIGLYYYLRVIVVVFGSRSQHQTQPMPVIHAPPRTTFCAAAALAVAVGVMLWLGAYPSPMIQVIQEAVTAILR